MRLETTLGNGLRLKDPFVIASSHWTAGERAFRDLSAQAPAAVTLKTTSHRGGAGTADAGLKRTVKARLRDSFGNPFAEYTDGPKALELWDVPTTLEMSQHAKAMLPHTVLGLSVLSGEDYGSLRGSLDIDLYGYVELNLKYSFRGLRLAEWPDRVETISSDIQSFLETFGSMPRFVKLPRELAPFLRTEEVLALLTRVTGAGAGLVVANTVRTSVPPSRSPEGTQVLDKGVVAGEQLLLQTFDMIRSITSAARDKGLPKPVIMASGGLVDIGGVVDVLAAGADAFQLCTVLDLHRVEVLGWLREQLQQLGAVTHNSTLSEYAGHLHGDDSVTWRDSIAASRHFALERKVLDRAFDDEALLERWIADTLVEECTLKEPMPPPNVEPPEGLALAYTCGNVASMALGVRLSQVLRCGSTKYDFASDFLKALRGKAPPHYDLALLPESSVLELEHSPPTAPELQPRILGVVGRSIVEIVGPKTARMDSTSTRIYHFGGRSARRALKDLLAAGAAKPQLEKIDQPHTLIPLLRFWPEDCAILAKPPLTRFYSLLVPADRRGGWGALWRTTEPIVLVASRAFVDKYGMKVAGAILSHADSLRREILDAPGKAAAIVVQQDFLKVCRRMIVPQD